MIDVEGRPWKWYDLREIPPMERPIDMLVVDGPPAGVQHLARYPALPVLRHRLARTAEIFLDDGARDDEREIAKLWGTQIDDIEVTWLETEKGGFWLHPRR